jgi:protein-S-isoprenylcysteine O-methyltransferase Ste14
MWVIAAIWTALMLLAIAFEERELRTRFGAEYDEYARQVPRFLPAWRGARR